MGRKQRRTSRKYVPYKAVKMDFFSMPDPFDGASPERRLEILRSAGANAKAAFRREFPRVQEWFDRHDPLYILAFCLHYFLVAERGVDKEAIDGKLDFSIHHLELLQAIALMKRYRGSSEPLGERARELQESLKRLTDLLIATSFDFAEGTPLCRHPKAVGPLSDARSDVGYSQPRVSRPSCYSPKGALLRAVRQNSVKTVRWRFLVRA